MNQGYSGSFVQRSGKLVEKVSSDQEFISSPARQKDLVALSRSLEVLPRIERIEGASIFMEYVAGQEGLTVQNAPRVGRALRRLHEQRGYPHPCMTGLGWLVDLANENLAKMGRDERIAPEMARDFPGDALIHSEPVQVIERPDGSIVFIDFEGIGMGSRYQDLGFIYYTAVKEGLPELSAGFLQGYQAEGTRVEQGLVERIAGLVALAYVGFALSFAGPEEAEKRLQLGRRLFFGSGD